MNKWIWLLFSMISSALLVSCSSDKDSEVETITIADPAQEGIGDSEPVAIRVILNTVNMRESPSMNSKVIAKLAANSDIEWLQQVSKVTAPVKLRGVRYNDPWLYVKADDTKGWVYAATIKVLSTNLASLELKQTLLNRRIQTFFGKELAGAINNYRMAYAQAKTSDNFANMYAYGLSLRDQIVQTLANKANVDPKAPADMTWLDSLLPGYFHTVVARGTKYYLFADYKQLAEKAKQTKGDEDDQLIALYQAIFPEGRESFFPVWMIQTASNTAVSRLGSGIHKSILDKLESLSKESPLFIPVFTSIKQELVSDITNPKTSFAEKKNKRNAELNAIIKSSYSILNDQDIAAIKASIPAG